MILIGAMYLVYIDTSSATCILVVYEVSIYNKYMYLLYAHIFACFCTSFFAIFYILSRAYMSRIYVKKLDMSSFFTCYIRTLLLTDVVLSSLLSRKLVTY